MAKRARRASVAEERAARERRSGLFKIAGVAVAVAAVGVLYYSVMSGRKALDPETLCPAEPTSMTVLLVDVTDPLNPAQRQDFMNQLAGLKNSIPRYGQLTVAKVDATSDKLLAPVIVRCNPGTAADANSATGDPGKLQKQWEEGFSRPLDAAFEQLSKASGAETSPILESIQSVNLTELQKPATRDKPKRLIIVSDLLQNTAEASFYGALPTPETFLASPAFQKARTDLRGVELELWMLQRPDGAATQPRALPDLWDAAISKQGGFVKRVYNVSG
ncbi:MAG: hypothetical protein EPN98_07825 [Phenylobacterium sp.]|uniref:hypothetical protein n=1 Tax=Phenylobacterium sp. TaxID=1871053 RepID=UPI001210CECF|nr:hypothetical protein [Phenylobacterium sp.]TAL34957.1 MAG: hypothetical protein EPN98_07825 [Phenylobacterium sp.]